MTASSVVLAAAEQYDPLKVMGAIGGTTVLWVIGCSLAAALITLWLASMLWRRRVRRAFQPLRRSVTDTIASPRSAYSLEETLREVAQRIDRANAELAAARTKELELDAILTSMVEGVLAVDLQQRVLTINEAACRMLGAKQNAERGTPLLEVARIPELQDLIQSVLDSRASHEVEFHSFGDTIKTIRAQGAALREAEGTINGVVVVLDDITRLKQLEIIRRDFVANVSHELKTPITSIKGYIETVLDGAADDAEEQRKFLQIVAKQSDRLNAIIDDLLALAHIEQQTDQRGIRLQVRALLPVLQEAIELSQASASAHQITLVLDCDESLQAAINAPLLEQAITNLIDNACKYSPEGSCVAVRASRDDSTIAIRVVDEGPGIEARHLPRLFERFYRVDRSRSRKLGGTGLGLAIVKHIAQAHHGTVSVESTPGQGSTFIVRLPAGQTDATETSAQSS